MLERLGCRNLEQLLGKRLWDTLAPEDASGDLYAMLRTTSGAIDQDWCTPRGDRRRVRWEAQGVSVGSESQSPYVLVTGMDLTTLEATRPDSGACCWLEGLYTAWYRLEGLWDQEREALAEKWKALFRETRERFKAETGEIAIANKAYRLRELQRIIESTRSPKLKMEAMEHAVHQMDI